jgi:hypothetical protein
VAAEAVDGPAAGVAGRDGADEDGDDDAAEEGEGGEPVPPRPNVGAPSDGFPAMAAEAPTDLAEVELVASDALGVASDALGAALDALGVASGSLEDGAEEVGPAPEADGGASSFFADAVDAAEAFVAGDGEAPEDAAREDEELCAAGPEAAAAEAGAAPAPVASALPVALAAEAAGGATAAGDSPVFLGVSGEAGAAPAGAAAPALSRFTSAGSRSMVAGSRRAFEWRIFGGLTIPCSDWAPTSTGASYHIRTCDTDMGSVFASGRRQEGQKRVFGGLVGNISPAAAKGSERRRDMRRQAQERSP